MKTLGLLLIIIGLLFSSDYALSELSVEDLEKIRQIVNETETRLGKSITDVETRVEKRISDVEKQFSNGLKLHGERITDLRARVDFQGNLIIALICAIIAFVSAPLAYIAYQFNKYRARQEAEMDVMKQRMEELEGRQIIQT
ncbi:hypothetical protein F4009_05020 [Candidatus Poribacteria bacterium]|nr:hypothetical protein [Candidatus Poribacteria bacterium]MYH81841.1 hypothetical protein [Candidatus Poribacteria bacterium]MYK93349.1 hypothetical protein [Candidatus Poribacteria bacterium]